MMGRGRPERADTASIAVAAVVVLVGLIGLAVSACVPGGEDESRRSGPSSEADQEAAATSSSALPLSSALPSSSLPDSTTVPPVPEFEICRLPVASFGGWSPTNNAYEVLETYDQDHPDEWAGWTFDGVTDGQPAFRAFVTRRPDFHRAELQARMSEPVSPLEVEITDISRAALQPLADRLDQALELEGGAFGRTVLVAPSRDRDTGAVRTRVWVASERADDETRRSVADVVAEDADRVCLAPRIGPVRADGDQPTSGPGWRLLDETVSGRGRLEVAATPEAYRALWAEARTGTDAPPVDFDREVVVYAGTGTGGCTSIFLTGVAFDQRAGADPGMVTVTVDRPLCGDGGELTLLVSRGYLLAVDRDRLPPRFELRLDNRGGAVGAEPITVDLADTAAEVDRLGDPRLDLTLAPETDDRTWIVDGETLGPSPQLLFHDVFELLPEDMSTALSEAEIAALMEPRLWSQTVPVDTTGVRVEVQSCVDDECTEPEICQLDLVLDHYDHVAVTLTLGPDDGCRFGPVTSVTS